MTENNKYLDELFQSKFAGFEAEPPAAVWDNIHKELHGKGGGSINPINLAVIAALVLISGLLGFSIINDVPQLKNEVDHNMLITALYVDDEPQAASPVIIAETTDEISAQYSPDDPVSALPINENTLIASEEPDHEALHAEEFKTSYAPSFTEKSRLAKMKARRSLAVHAGLPLPGTEDISVRDSEIMPRFNSAGQKERAYHRNDNWQVGVFFTPSVVFFQDDSIPNQRSYTIDGSVRWNRNDFFIESGLGVSFSSDEGKYSINYEQYLGSYDDVYNVIYDTGQNGELIPIYFTNVVNVYDSVSRYTVDQTSNHYTYLQIPVYIGFNKQFDRFGWYVKGGPVLSLLVHKNIPNPDAGYNRIVGLDQDMATRVSTNWQLSFSVGMSYQLSNKVSLGIEPTFRYYLNSEYDRKYFNTRHPYSLGLRAGLMFNF